MEQPPPPPPPPPSSSCSSCTCWQGSRDVVLASEGSVARDHLANERTFLSWLRTSVSMIGLGIALAKFSVGEKEGIVSASLLCAAGLLAVLYARQRYFNVLDALRSGKFVYATRSIDVVVVGLTVLSITILLILVTVTPSYEGTVIGV